MGDGVMSLFGISPLLLRRHLWMAPMYEKRENIRVFLPIVGLLALLEALNSELSREPDPEIPLEADVVDLLVFEQQ